MREGVATGLQRARTKSRIELIDLGQALDPEGGEFD